MASALYLALLVAISAFMAAPSSIEAQFLPSLPGIVAVNGTVSCTLNATFSSNATVPPFSNATVLLRCGNTTVGNTTSSTTGLFSIVVRRAQDVLTIISSLLPGGPGCKVVVNTPLANCNPTLPTAGILQGNITQVVVGTLNGFPLYTLILSALNSFSL